MEKARTTIQHFIEKMNYLENEHVLGVFFCGSYLSGFQHKNSDIDLNIVFDQSQKDHLVRGTLLVDGIRIEYFEKPIQDLYDSVDRDYQNQNNALLSIIGTAEIIFDKTGELKKLQDYTQKKFEKSLPPLAQEKAKEKIAILYNRFEEIKTAEQENSPYFYLLYYIFLEKVRKFYHQLHGLPEVQTAKIFKVYTDPEYQEAFYRDRLPEEEFITMYLNAAATPSRNQEELLQLASNLFQYTIKAIPFDRENHRIYIKSRKK